MARIISHIFQLVALMVALCDVAFAAKILAFGDLRGHLEPCGCDPRTDVGGLKRVASSLLRYRTENPELIVLHSGNLFPKVIKDKAEAVGISRAIEMLTPDASLVNDGEWSQLSSGEKLPNANWILSNAKNNSIFAGLTPIKTVRNTEIFGYLDKADKNLIPFNHNLLKQWKKLSKAKRNSDRVLIFSGNDSELEKIAQANFFGIIISANTTKIGVEVGDQEQRSEQTLIRRSKNKFLAWSVPFGGGGFLRQGGLELKDPPKTLAASLGGGKVNRMDTLNGEASFAKSQPIHWLRSGEEDGAPDNIIKVFDEVRDSNKKSFWLMADQRVKDLQGTNFVGAEACASCHKSSYEIWLNSKHATAMRSLVNKDRHEDVVCVECHVVGYASKGGYVSEKKTPNFSNVQCENCHGPRREHVLNPSISEKTDARKVCSECHTPPHSPGFDMTNYWKMIEHK